MVTNHMTIIITPRYNTGKRKGQPNQENVSSREARCAELWLCIVILLMLPKLRINIWSHIHSRERSKLISACF